MNNGDDDELLDSEDDEDSEESILYCPFCGKLVDTLFSVTSPCSCVVAWAAYGEELTWENASFHKEAQKLKRLQRKASSGGKHDDDDLEIGSAEIKELFKNTHDVVVMHNDDGAGHGHSSGAYFIFVREKQQP